MTLERNASVGDSAVALLPSQFSSSTRLQELLRALVSPLIAEGTLYGRAAFGSSGYGADGDGYEQGQQGLEDALEWLLTTRWIGSAYGFLLDLVGEIVGCPRRFTDDERYRADIYLQVGINTSQADAERLIEVTQKVASAAVVQYLFKPDATVVLYANAVPDLASVVPHCSRIEDAAAAGKTLIITAGEDEIPFALGFDRDSGGTEYPTDDEPIASAGLGELGLGVGGSIVELIAASE